MPAPRFNGVVRQMGELPRQDCIIYRAKLEEIIFTALVDKSDIDYIIIL